MRSETILLSQLDADNKKRSSTSILMRKPSQAASAPPAWEVLNSLVAAKCEEAARGESLNKMCRRDFHAVKFEARNTTVGPLESVVSARRLSCPTSGHLQCRLAFWPSANEFAPWLGGGGKQQAGVAIRIKPVAAGDRMGIGALHGLEAAEGRHQHE